MPMRAPYFALDRTAHHCVRIAMSTSHGFFESLTLAPLRSARSTPIRNLHPFIERDWFTAHVQQFNYTIACDGNQPRHRASSTRCERISRLPCTDQDILQRLLSERRVPEHSQQHAE